VKNSALNVIIAKVVDDAESKMQVRLHEFKGDFVEMIVDVLENKTTGLLRGFIGNATELVEALVPASNLRYDTDLNDDVTTVFEMPEAQTYVNRNVAAASNDIPWWWLVLPGVVLGALIALRWPRIGLAVAIVVPILTVIFSEEIAFEFASQATEHGNVSFTLKLPENVTDLGGPEELKIQAYFYEKALRLVFAPIPMATLNTMITNLAMQAADEPKGIPIRLVALDLKMRAEGHLVEIRELSNGHVDAEADLSCFPKCEGSCGGIIKC